MCQVEKNPKLEMKHCKLCKCYVVVQCSKPLNKEKVCRPTHKGADAFLWSSVICECPDIVLDIIKIIRLPGLKPEKSKRKIEIM